MGAFYSKPISEFLEESQSSIIGTLTQAAGSAGYFQQLHSQTASWEVEIEMLKKALKGLLELNLQIIPHILLEYPIPRRAKRIDAVLLVNDLVIIIEFKIGQPQFLSTDKEQLLDYCLDIRDFHAASRDKTIIPVLCASNAKSVNNKRSFISEQIETIQFCNDESLVEILSQVLKNVPTSNEVIDPVKWNDSDYSPTPTIIEAARTLYMGKSVIEISQTHASKKNLTKTSNAVINAIEDAKINEKKIICFITGVPGAGKTLAGLNIAHHREFQNNSGSLATFLSGNGPLITVLQAALTKDAKKNAKNSNKSNLNEAEKVKTFVENVHRFIDHYFEDKNRIPNNKIVIFDEAQRAWNREQSKRKFNRDFSEPEIMLETMGRHKDWAAIVALVGGGQEINTGEAGLSEWGKILDEKFPDWEVHISPQLKIGDHSTGNLTLFKEEPANVKVIEDDDLHLAVSIRSYKAEKLSNWVSLLLSNQPEEAKSLFYNSLSKYKIKLTRDLTTAKSWLTENCHGTRRMGLVASSNGRRLRPYGLDVRLPLEGAEWFLNNRNDVRSSYFLEIPATEFGIQGLELDWTGVCWDLDLRRTTEDWTHFSFKGTAWQKVGKKEMQNFITNKYRVLLTRAREGMIIFVPEGDITDETRPPSEYNRIADYLKSCGVKEI